MHLKRNFVLLCVLKPTLIFGVLIDIDEKTYDGTVNPTYTLFDEIFSKYEENVL